MKKSEYILMPVILIFLALSSCKNTGFSGNLYCLVGKGVIKDCPGGFYQFGISPQNVEPVRKLLDIDTGFISYDIAGNELLCSYRDRVMALNLQREEKTRLLPYPVDEFKLSPSGQLVAFLRNHTLYISNMSGNVSPVLRADSSVYSLYNPFSGSYYHSEIQYLWTSDSELLIGYHEGEFPETASGLIPANTIGLAAIADNLHTSVKNLDIKFGASNFEFLAAGGQVFVVKLSKETVAPGMGIYDNIKNKDSAVVICNWPDSQDAVNSTPVKFSNEEISNIKLVKVLNDDNVLFFFADKSDILVSETDVPGVHKPIENERYYTPVRQKGLVINSNGSQIAYISENGNNYDQYKYKVRIKDLSNGKESIVMKNLDLCNYYSDDPNHLFLLLWMNRE